MSKSRQDRKKEVDRRPLAKFQYRGFVVQEGRSGTWYASKGDVPMCALKSEDEVRGWLDQIIEERRRENGHSS